MVVVKFLGKRVILRILRAARFKKEFTLANPQPWVGDPSKLSAAQKDIVGKFTTVATRTAGIPLSQRMEIMKKVLSGYESPYTSEATKARKKYPLPAKSPEAIRTLIETLRSELGIAAKA